MPALLNLTRRTLKSFEPFRSQGWAANRVVVSNHMIRYGLILVRKSLSICDLRNQIRQPFDTCPCVDDRVSPQHCPFFRFRCLSVASRWSQAPARRLA